MRGREAVMMMRMLIGAAVGAVLGFGGHKLAGCPTDACPLTANPFVATLYGMTAGAVIATSFH